jgi:hypothetical protein
VDVFTVASTFDEWLLRWPEGHCNSRILPPCAARPARRRRRRRRRRSKGREIWPGIQATQCGRKVYGDEYNKVGLHPLWRPRCVRQLLGGGAPSCCREEEVATPGSCLLGGCVAACLCGEVELIWPMCAIPEPGCTRWPSFQRTPRQFARAWSTCGWYRSMRKSKKESGASKEDARP